MSKNNYDPNQPRDSDGKWTSGSIVHGRGEKPDPHQQSAKYPTIWLEPQEYAHVMSELATHMPAKYKHRKIVTRPIGNFYYTVENRGFGNYRVIDRVPIDEEDDYEF